MPGSAGHTLVGAGALVVSDVTLALVSLVGALDPPLPPEEDVLGAHDASEPPLEPLAAVVLDVEVPPDGPVAVVVVELEPVG